LFLQFDVEETLADTEASITSLKFIQKDTGTFYFNTGTLSGILREEGKSTGLMPIRYRGDSVSISKGEGLFNHYRVFTEGKRYGYGARNWPSKAELNSEGDVSVFWTNTPDRPFDLQGIYRIVAPNVIDLVTIVHARRDLKKFEVFLASYLNQEFTESKIYSSQNIDQKDNPSFISASKEFGEWLAFPRDKQALKVINDGRWTLQPHPLDWTVMPYYALPLAIRQNKSSGLTVVAMAKREDCFGIFTPYNEDKHYSHYLSLFGYDIKKGETAQAYARLVVLKNPTDDEIVQIAHKFILE
jgi:hypothetical protein